MTLRLYDTMKRKSTTFTPADPGNVRMYACGPTVYDAIHVGNARPAVAFDVLFRLLRHEYGDTAVTYVRNITDVDDKINARAARDFAQPIAAGETDLNGAVRRLTDETAARFGEHCAALGCLPPTHEPRATEFVAPRADGLPDMVSMTAALLERGHAYEAGGEVLFDVSSFPAYGRLSRRTAESLKAGARVEEKGHKRSPGDFVLWKPSSDSEPGWESPWGRGRPGWHIECSVMSAAYLGETFDIHAGGADLVFPHHENEIAQSCCAHGSDAMARYWLHNGFVQVEGRKMAKSEGNFVTVRDLLETEAFGGRRWPGRVIRMALLMTHYREPLDFSVRRLEEAASLCARLDDHAAPGHAGDVPGEFLERLRDDLGTARALNWLLAARNGGTLAPEQAGSALALMGFAPAAQGTARILPEHAALVEARARHVAGRRWPEADAIREELAAAGVTVRDVRDPASGERKSEWSLAAGYPGT